jgi:hypothetical protein
MEQNVSMAPIEELPPLVKSAPVSVLEAYQYAVANPDILSQIPCYCGCGGMEHTSTDGTITFDTHALGCSICVDIAQDTMRLHVQGRDVDEIFNYVDNKFAQFGPPTLP